MKKLLILALLLNAAMLAGRLWQEMPANAQQVPVATENGDEQAEILGHMSIVQLPVDNDGNTAKTIRFTGVNVQIVNGLGATNGNPDDPNSLGRVGEPPTSTNALGNLIVGYNEERPRPDNLIDIRTGSHNIVVGQRHNYSSFGGLVGGRSNTISGAYSSVSGGSSNEASGFHSSVSGGTSNTASGHWSSVSGGVGNTASGPESSVSGGGRNTASGVASSVSGGDRNTASGVVSTVSGGRGVTVQDEAGHAP